MPSTNWLTGTLSAIASARQKRCGFQRRAMIASIASPPGAPSNKKRPRGSTDGAACGHATTKDHG